jgi:hypothetical protein
MDQKLSSAVEVAQLVKKYAFNSPSFIYYYYYYHHHHNHRASSIIDPWAVV